ncbi:copper resistance protein CopC [Corynebacterium uropygiale]|uniref:Copper resistance protein CopC n=1 Tax=Corynebacterium uropygiale TaxID=1775911 RepID=A0A9X1U074_9CORY|nr:copper resistance CopC family protein [Corynebacterium uropygiale]MCF4006514.1 copper resistance protein CopC [Corynebacterium uropygiale]
MASSVIRPSRCVAAAAALVVGGAVAGIPAAQAHDVVIDANPPVDGVVEEFPREITLTFSGEPQPAFNMFAISNTDTGEILYSGEPKLDGRYLSIATPDDVHPGPGTYTIGFQITSSDGHATRGSTDFRVGDGGASAAAGSSSANQPGTTSGSEEQDTGSPLAWIAGAIGVLLVVGIIAVVILRRRALGNEQDS